MFLNFLRIIAGMSFLGQAEEILISSIAVIMSDFEIVKSGSG